MPTYEWKCLECGSVDNKITTRDTSLYRTPPEKCSACENGDPEKFEKYIGGAPTASYGAGWTPWGGSGKGNW